MLFKFPKKKLVLHAFISELDKNIYTHFPVQNATKFYPDWWKDLPKSHFSFGNMRTQVTMKGCVGLYNLYRNSAIMPIWTDVAIKSEKTDYYYYFGDKKTISECHSLDQRKGFKEDYFHMKILSPWLFCSEKGVNFMFMEPYWNYTEEKGFEIPPGIVDFYYNYQTNINILLMRERDNYIKANTPILMIQPISERTLELKTEMLSVREYTLLKTKNLNVFSDTGYPNLIKMMNETEIRNKCPFGFGRKK